jgi:UDPglucose 6-dehydrogenase
VRIVDWLQRRGAAVRAHDPLASGEARSVLRGVTVCDDPYEAARGSHLVMLLNACEEFRRLDLARLRSIVAEPRIVDGVNVLDPEAARRAGFTYHGVGRR